MKQVLTAALFAAGFAAFGAPAGAEELHVPASLTSFGAPPDTAYQMSAASLALGPAQTFSRNTFSGSAIVLPVTFGGAVLPQNFAASTALNINLALDAGYNLDLSRRFDNYGGPASPLLEQGNYLGLANGGHYAGVTFAATPSLRLRLGAQFSNQLDGVAYDPALVMSGLPLAYDNATQRSVLAGASWDFANWAGLNLSAIVGSRKGQPIGLNPVGDLTTSGASTSALNVSAHVDFGSGWVTTASFSDGLTQLDQKSGTSASIDGHSYSIAIAKHGLFGQDAVGFSFSQPSPNLLDNGLQTLASSGDLPPVVVAANRFSGTGSTPETDLQLGYVTSFMNGALALQANAAYEMNYQGQSGATSLAVLSRAKIKF